MPCRDRVTAVNYGCKCFNGTQKVLSLSSCKRAFSMAVAAKTANVFKSHVSYSVKMPDFFIKNLKYTDDFSLTIIHRYAEDSPGSVPCLFINAIME